MAPAKMNQWTVLDKENGFDGLTYGEVPVPKVGENEVLVKFRAASLNYRDLIIPKGMYPFAVSFPVVPASDGSGEIVEVGSKVTLFKKGDQVSTLFNQTHQYGPIDAQAAGSGLGGVIDGALRQYGVFNESGLVKNPKNLNHLEASTLPCAALTSWNALYGLKPLKPGEIVLVQGTGGVSIFALQFAKAAGATVIATTSSTPKAEKLKQLGADHVINYKADPNWGETARKLTPDNAGVDHIIEVGGTGTLAQSFKCIKLEGIISIIGFLGGVDPKGQPSILDALSNICAVRGVLVGSKALMNDMVKAIEANNIHPVVDEKVFTLEQTREAYEYMKHRPSVPMQVNTTQPSSLPILGPQPQQQQQQARQPQQQPRKKQLTFIRPAQMSLFARVSCYPPLGEVTCPSRVQKALELEKDDMLRFTVVIESSSAFPEQPWEAQIWHNLNTATTSNTNTKDNSNAELTALPLRKIPGSSVPLLNGKKAEYRFHRCVFSEEIPLPAQGGYAQFTVRFRTGSTADWQWVNEQQRDVKDGELVFAPRDPSTAAAAVPAAVPATQPAAPTTPAPAARPSNPWASLASASASASTTTPTPTPAAPSAAVSSSSAREQFSKCFESLSSEVEVEARVSEAPNSVLWQLAGSVPPAGEQSSTKDIVLGVPSSVARWFSLVRIWTPWLGPRHGKKKFRLTEDAILCSFLRTDGTHLVLLAVSGVDHMLTVFGSGENGEVVVKAQSDHTETAKFQVLAAVADNFEVAMSAVIYEARKLVRVIAEDEKAAPEEGEEKEEEEKQATPASSSPSEDMVMVEKDPKVQWLSQWYDGLTYCTWNGLGQDLTEEKILHALDTLKSHGIKIVNLIIDDNWQTLDNDGGPQFKRRWTQFEGNPRAFPEGLKQTVQAIRRRQPSIEHIAVWHAMFGYWGGISPDGDLAQRFTTKEVKIKDPVAGGPIARAFDRGSMLAIEPDDIQTFYDEFYSYLTSVGIDAVKTDAQFFLDLLEDPEDRRRFIASYQDAWSIASLKHFSTRSISCMSTFPQAIFHSQLPNNKPNIPLRNSDDFFPEVPASHQWHVFCNAHNALLTRFLNVLPDWDMFQTSHPYASFHAAARCVSGGPIYITDEPGKHDTAVLNQMTAPTTHGTTVILRPSIVGRAMDMYHDYNEGHVLSVGTYTGYARTGSGILGLFNTHDAESCKMVSLRDFPGIHEGSDGQYIVRAHTSGRITDPMHPTEASSLVMIELSQKGWEILTAYPTKSFTLKGSRGCGSSNNNLTHVAVLGLLGKMTGAAAIVSSDIFIVENGRLRFDVALKALGTLGIYFSDLEDHSIARNFIVMIAGRVVPRKTVWKEGGEGAKVLAVDVLSAWKAMGLDSGWGNEAIVQVFVG